MRTIIATSLIFLFWFMLSGHTEPLMIVLGLLSTMLTIYLSRRMKILDSESYPYRLSTRLFNYYIYLGKEIITANFDVIKRILKPGGIFAAWSYNLLSINLNVDEHITDLYSNLLAQYWPAERTIVENGYKSVNFPFEELTVPGFNMTIEWTFEQIISYLSTWSAVNAYISSNNQNPVDLIYDELLHAWGNIDRKRLVTWPLTVRVWQKP